MAIDCEQDQLLIRIRIITKIWMISAVLFDFLSAVWEYLSDKKLVNLEVWYSNFDRFKK